MQIEAINAVQPQLITDCANLPWHVHHEAYAAIVLEGSYLEAGASGRRTVGPGEVIVHHPFSGHANWFNGSRIAIVNISLGHSPRARLQSGTLTDPLEVLRQVTDTPFNAEHILFDAILPSPSRNDLPDILAADLAAGRVRELQRWADDAGATARTLRRHFIAAYGITPNRFRALSRARRAWELLVTTSTNSAEIAYHLGFADQAHMSRSVTKLTGRRPSDWRRGGGR